MSGAGSYRKALGVLRSQGRPSLLGWAERELCRAEGDSASGDRPDRKCDGDFWKSPDFSETGDHPWF
jgi:hypothetical protein